MSGDLAEGRGRGTAPDPHPDPAPDADPAGRGGARGRTSGEGVPGEGVSEGSVWEEDVSEEGVWVDPAQVERALVDLWRSDRTGPAMIRACLSNLVVVCGDRGQRAAVEAELPEIARHHPSRILLVLEDPAAAGVPGSEGGEGAPREEAGAGEAGPGSPGAHSDSSLDAHVSALCHVGGKEGRTCSEQVLLAARGRAAEALPAVARSLLLADLPTVLWWTSTHGPPPPRSDRFWDFAALAGHVVYDSGPWIRGPEELRVLTEGLGAPGRPYRIGDLAWLRTEPWRRLLAQTLDPARVPGALAGLCAVEIEHGPRGAAEAWLLGAWLARCLGWEPRGGEATRWELAARERTEPEVEVRLRRADGDGGGDDVEGKGDGTGAGGGDREGTHGVGAEAGGAPAKDGPRAARAGEDRRRRGASEASGSGLRAVRVVWRSGGREHAECFERTGPGRLAATGCAGAESALADPWSEPWELVVQELSRRSHHGLFRETLAAAAAVAGSLAP